MRMAHVILVGGMIVVGAAALFGTLLLLPSGAALAEDAMQSLLAPEAVKWGYASAAAAAALSAIGAGYAVAQVGSAAVGALAEKPELMGKSLIYVALAEGIAIYGLLIAIIVLAKV